MSIFSHLMPMNHGLIPFILNHDAVIVSSEQQSLDIMFNLLTNPEKVNHGNASC